MSGIFGSGQINHSSAARSSSGGDRVSTHKAARRALSLTTEISPREAELIKVVGERLPERRRGLRQEGAVGRRRGSGRQRTAARACAADQTLRGGPRRVLMRNFSGVAGKPSDVTGPVFPGGLVPGLRLVAACQGA